MLCEVPYKSDIGVGAGGSNGVKSASAVKRATQIKDGHDGIKMEGGISYSISCCAYSVVLCCFSHLFGQDTVFWADIQLDIT